jgi:multidrug efflux pump
MSRFFIERPIFAWVIAIVIMLAGAISIVQLPIAQYPQIAPPTVSIATTYPGASAKTVENSVTQVIEQAMNGLDNLLYIQSTSASNGAAQVTITFTNAANPDIAQVQVQNKLQQAIALLPAEVQQQGVVVTKSNSSFLMVIGFVSKDGTMSATDLADYVATHVLDPMSRVSGVGNVRLFGGQYAMRIWIDPNKLLQYHLEPGDVTTAIRAQNAQVSVGQLGGTPAVSGTELNATISGQDPLQTPAQFETILLKTNADGSTVHLSDVARVELGSETYEVDAQFNGQPAAGVAISLGTGANAIGTAAAVQSELAQLEVNFPAGMQAVIPYDTTPFVKVSIEEVARTLLEAVVLVFIVMFLFLQNLRATLIPTIAVPVVLLGTFAVLSFAGFSINTLTMFAMVLAIGLLVDDAIVVVENVERVMSEERLSPKQATQKSMSEITGALVGIALVLAAVFVPMAFFGGSTGVIYRQFAITLVSAMVLSVIVALIFTPALCATLLRHTKPREERAGFFGWFNRTFDRGNSLYRGGLRSSLRHVFVSLLVYAVVVGGLATLFLRLPTSFVPEEDQGTLFALVQLPPGATQQRTLSVLGRVRDHFLKDEKDAVASIFTVAGFSFSGAGQNVGLAFVKLKDWSERTTPELKAQAVAGRAMGAFFQFRDAIAFAFAPPAVQGLGQANGFDFFLEDRGGLGHDALIQARNQLLSMAAQEPTLSAVRPNGQDDVPQFAIDVDQAKAGALGVSVADINSTLSIAWGGTYVNDFIDRGRVKHVFVQADAPYRMDPEELSAWHVRNASGDMVPFSAFATTHWTYGSPRLERYNGVPAVEIQGQASPGTSSGAALDTIDRLVKQLPAGFSHEWTGLSYQERLSGNQAPVLYGVSLVVVFLCLAALYESWSIPFSVMLIVPLGFFGAVVAATLFGQSNDVYFQVALLTTIGLAAKNAILIVQFALLEQSKGKRLIDATIEAVRLRLRPILMTSFSFVFGVTPLALAHGAGSGSQNAIGIGVMGGMIAAILLGVTFVPLFFVTVRRLVGGETKSAPVVEAEPSTYQTLSHPAE